MDKDLETRVIIIGGGRFGTRASEILARRPNLSISLVDKEEIHLDGVAVSIKQIRRDGIRYLVDKYPECAPDTIIVPALPVHLAASWLLQMPLNGVSLNVVEMPSDALKFLPHYWPGDFGTLLISHADFLCPDDCPEPEDGCTVTGELRTPLYEILRGLAVEGFRNHVIQSHQLAPGLGGYRISDLTDLMGDVSNHGTSKWLVGTSCRCHGVLTAIGASSA